MLHPALSEPVGSARHTRTNTAARSEKDDSEVIDRGGPHSQSLEESFGLSTRLTTLDKHTGKKDELANVSFCWQLLTFLAGVGQVLSHKLAADGWTA